MAREATIQQILDIQPIQNADNIETATILGWKVVVRKDEFKIGDKCIYVEIDSVLPEKEEFEFLKNKNYRIKTIKLRKQISQGICFPLSIVHNSELERNLSVGDDVSDILGVTHYEKVVFSNEFGKTRNFPSYLIKTDENRIQSYPEYIDQMKGRLCYITTKLDGTSATYSHHNDEHVVCSRNMSLELDTENIYTHINNTYQITNQLKELGNYCVQGEICGPGIQKNRLELHDIDFFAFNLFDIDNYEYVDFKESFDIFNKFNLKAVPIIYIGNFHKEWDLEYLLNLAKGQYQGTRNNQEGIVIRTTKKPRISFKVVNNDYLLHDEE